MSNKKVELMICDSCQVERLVTDFINNQKICYKCMYKQKLKKSMEKRTKKKFKCRCCEKEFMQEESIKTRQRTVFCSCECAEKGHNKQVENYWTRKITNENCRPKRGAYKWKTNQK